MRAERKYNRISPRAKGNRDEGLMLQTVPTKEQGRGHLTSLGRGLKERLAEGYRKAQNHEEKGTRPWPKGGLKRW